MCLELVKHTNWESYCGIEGYYFFNMPTSKEQCPLLHFLPLDCRQDNVVYERYTGLSQWSMNHNKAYHIAWACREKGLTANRMGSFYVPTSSTKMQMVWEQTYNYSVCMLHAHSNFSTFIALHSSDDSVRWDIIFHLTSTNITLTNFCSHFRSRPNRRIQHVQTAAKIGNLLLIHRSDCL